MNKILYPQDLSKLSSPKKVDKKIVLVGGCFDLLHVGHTKFLEASRKQGDILIVLLESDEKVRFMKGEKRPVNKISKRIDQLSKLSSVNYVIPLSGMTKDDEYDKLMLKIEPNVIALTKGDPNLKNRIIQARKVNAKVVEVMNKIEGISTTQLLK